MAKRKGKSQHRKKDWQRLHSAGEKASDDAESYRRLTQRKVRLPGQAQDAPIFAEIAPGSPQATGEVVQLYPGGAVVRTDACGELLCGLAGTFRPAPNSSALAVGDQVTLALTAEAQGLIAAGQLHLDPNRVDALILQRAPRATALSRPQPMRGKRLDPHSSEVFEKVIAANMDQLVVVIATAVPPPRRRLLDRYLIVAQRGELPMRLAVNKIDLAEPDEQLLADYAELGVSAVRCSAATGAGLDDLRTMLAGRKSILAGASGVGKSSLLNALLPSLNLPTRAVRDRDDRGRHTTTAATLYDLPFGGQVVDTPGIRELGLEMGAGELPWYFPDIMDLAAGCKFRDCTHTHEPGCAVQAAAENGDLPARRFESYLRIFETLQE